MTDKTSTGSTGPRWASVSNNLHEDAPDLLPGYRLLRHLGGGAFGAVYLAEARPGSSVFVAIKVFRRLGAEGEKAAATEAAALTKLSDLPGVLRLYGRGKVAFRDEGECHYLVTRYVHGWPLQDAPLGDIPLGTRLACFAAFLDTLVAAHARFVFQADAHHRNVLVEQDRSAGVYRLVLIDWGLADLYDGHPQNIVRYDLEAIRRLLRRLVGAASEDEPDALDTFQSIPALREHVANEARKHGEDVARPPSSTGVGPLTPAARDEAVARIAELARSNGDDSVMILRATEDEARQLDGRFDVIALELMRAFQRKKLWADVVRVFDTAGDEIRRGTNALGLCAMALNRQGTAPSRHRADVMLRQRIAELGPVGSDVAELNGHLGRLYKDAWKAALGVHPHQADALLDRAIWAYTAGFKADLNAYYPGVNAVTLSRVRGTPETLRHARKLAPAVRLAAEIAAERAELGDAHYFWADATRLELALIEGDAEAVRELQPRVRYVGAFAAGWNVETLTDNLNLILSHAREPVGGEHRALIAAAVADLELLHAQVTARPDASKSP